ncbi:hypothetical protein Scep_026978 [Stephania cephalantha]|uniref:NERD domain-containing protein n=1 Tax=Stephania cephalantha TaxID=152367 RepID=A0AAP0ELL5_9MAGN
MWVELLCGLVIFKLVKRFFYNDDLIDIETSDFNIKFHVANRLEKLYGGKVHLGLRIPDADSGSRQNIDMVLVTKKEAVVVNVWNFSGFLSVDKDGNWVIVDEKKGKTVKHHNPVVEAKKQVEILESYLEQRGVALPEGYLSAKVVLPNPKSRTIVPVNFPPEVITYDEWTQLKPEPKALFSGWIKDTFTGGKKEMQEGIHKQLRSVLGSVPMWDRLELKENKYLLGEFLQFKGKDDDISALRNIKRSKVSRLEMQRSTMFGLGHSKLQVLYFARDYRNEGTSASDFKEVTVRSSTEVLFQPYNSSKVRKFKLSSIISLSLSA